MICIVTMRQGDEDLPVQLADEIEALLTLEGARLSRWVRVPKAWQGKTSLNLPDDSYKKLDLAFIVDMDMIGATHGLVYPHACVILDRFNSI